MPKLISRAKRFQRWVIVQRSNAKDFYVAYISPDQTGVPPGHRRIIYDCRPGEDFLVRESEIRHPDEIERSDRRRRSPREACQQREQAVRREVQDAMERKMMIATRSRQRKMMPWTAQQQRVQQPTVAMVMGTKPLPCLPEEEQLAEEELDHVEEEEEGGDWNGTEQDEAAGVNNNVDDNQENDDNDDDTHSDPDEDFTSDDVSEDDKEEAQDELLLQTNDNTSDESTMGSGNREICQTHHDQNHDNNDYNSVEGGNSHSDPGSRSSDCTNNNQNANEGFEERHTEEADAAASRRLRVKPQLRKAAMTSTNHQMTPSLPICNTPLVTPQTEEDNVWGGSSHSNRHRGHGNDDQEGSNDHHAAKRACRRTSPTRLVARQRQQMQREQYVRQNLPFNQPELQEEQDSPPHGHQAWMPRSEQLPVQNNNNNNNEPHQEATSPCHRSIASNFDEDVAGSANLADSCTHDHRHAENEFDEDTATITTALPVGADVCLDHDPSTTYRVLVVKRVCQVRKVLADGLLADSDEVFDEKRLTIYNSAIQRMDSNDTWDEDEDASAAIINYQQEQHNMDHHPVAQEGSFNEQQTLHASPFAFVEVPRTAHDRCDDRALSTTEPLLNALVVPVPAEPPIPFITTISHQHAATTPPPATIDDFMPSHEQQPLQPVSMRWPHLPII